MVKTALFLIPFVLGGHALAAPAKPRILAPNAPTAESWKASRLESCRGNVKFDLFPKMLESKKIHYPDRVLNDIDRSFLCNALATSSPDRCNDILNFLPSRKDGPRKCKDNYLDYRFIEASLRNDPSAKSVCEQIMGGGSEGLDSSAKKLCDVLTGIYRSRNVNECNSLPGKMKMKCRENFLFFGGVRACRPIKDFSRRQECENAAAIEDAVASRNASRCGKSYECFALIVKSPQACERIPADAVANYCESQTGKDVQDEKNLEASFRRDNGLEAYRDGGPFLHLLPAAEKMKYERNKKYKGAKKTRARPKS